MGPTPCPLVFLFLAAEPLVARLSLLLGWAGHDVFLFVVVSTFYFFGLLKVFVYLLVVFLVGCKGWV